MTETPEPEGSRSETQAPEGIDRHWHLARTPTELAVTDLEYALLRGGESFSRWKAECLASVGDFSHSGAETAFLHIIRMNDRPKTIHDLAHMTNRQDIPNIQYSLRKLVAAGLVARSGAGRSGVTYEATELGRSVADRFARTRAAVLVAAVERVPGLAEQLVAAARTLELMTGIYDQATRVAATHRRRPGQPAPPPPPASSAE